MTRFWEHYLEILSDPAHLAVEVTLMLLVDVLFMGMVWPFAMRWTRNHIHRDLDREHRKIEWEHDLKHPSALDELDKPTMPDGTPKKTPYDYSREGL